MGFTSDRHREAPQRGPVLAAAPRPSDDERQQVFGRSTAVDVGNHEESKVDLSGRNESVGPVSCQLLSVGSIDLYLCFDWWRTVVANNRGANNERLMYQGDNHSVLME